MIASSFVFGQKSEFTVFGTITDCKTHEPTKGVTIKLVGDDKSSIETKSDSLGNYSFANCFKNNTNYTLTTQPSDIIGRGSAIKYGICPDTFYEKAGYGSSEKYKFHFCDTLQKLKYDFCLFPMIADYIHPTFYFKKNSVEFLSIEWGETINADTATDCFVSFLMAHKTLVIEIGGHSSSNENNKKELAEARAKKLYDLLVIKGIDKERLVCKSYSDTRPAGYNTEEGKWIENDKTNEKNRRVEIMALRRDYNSSKEHKATNNNSDGEN